MTDRSYLEQAEEEFHLMRNHGYDHDTAEDWREHLTAAVRELDQELEATARLIVEHERELDSLQSKLSDFSEESVRGSDEGASERLDEFGAEADS